MIIPTPLPQSQLNKSRFDKFLLVLNLPPIMRNSSTNNLSIRTKELVQKESIQFSVYGSVIPTVSVPEVEAPYAGGTYKLSSNSRPPYDNITVNFTIDNKFNNYWVIYKWLDIMSDDVGIIYNTTEVTDTGRETYKLNPKLQPQAYQTDFTLYGKDEFDNNIVKFTYTKAFPISLGSIDYNYREPGEIETSFTFAFSQFLTELV